MKKEIIVPAAGESVTEADIAEWSVENGAFVNLDDQLLELETDKASLPLNAEISGILTVLIEEGTVQVGDVLGYITASDKPESAPSATPKIEAVVSSPIETKVATTTNYASGHPSPSAARILSEKGISTDSVNGTGKNGRITKEDAQNSQVKVTQQPSIEPVQEKTKTVDPSKREKRTEKMSRMRRTISKRLVEAQQTAALLTTFNEVDLTEIMEIRKKYKDAFKEKHNVGLGFMSFFTKATSIALQEFPIMNAQVSDEEIVYHDYCDIGIAVSTPKGLVVPVVRNAESLNFQEIESAILGYALKGRSNQLTPEDMEGGTFTITNGGVFGSMMSTPIINRPQSAILGMHNIIQRPMVVAGEIKARPMMYLAVTYDHRIIDGSDAVRFLVKIKDLLEDPSRLLIGL